MANVIKISEMTDAGALTGAELFPLVQSGANYHATLSIISSFVGTSLSGTYEPHDDDLTAIAALGFTSTSFLKKTAVDTWALDTNTYLTSVTAHNLLSATHGDTLADTVVRGDILIGNSTPKWSRLAFPASPTGKVLVATATDIEWSTSALGTAAYTASTAYEVPLTFGSGLTRTVNAVTNDLITGKAGGQTVYGGLAQTEFLTLKGNIATASGTNIAGGDVYIDAVPGTGTGASTVHIRTGRTLTTGTTLQTLTEVVTILGNGSVGIGTTAPGSAGYSTAWDKILGIESSSGWVAIGCRSLDATKGALFNQINDQNRELIFGVFGQSVAGSRFGVNNANNAFIYTYPSNSLTIGTAQNAPLTLGTNYTARITILGTGEIGFGLTAPTSVVDIKAGTASVAPFGLASGPVLTSPLVGKLEFLADDLYFTITTGAARKKFIFNDGTNLTSGSIPKASTNGRLIDSPIVGNIQATFKSPASAGIFHAFGFYEAPANRAELNEGNTTQTMGSANNAYQSHAFLVAQQAGTVSGGTTGTAKITITGTSITSAGTRTASDSEIIVADITALGANTYIESTKMWLGQITYTLALTGDRTTCALNFNYGFVSANHFFEKSVTIQQFECTGRAGASDTGFNIQLLKHSNAGWTYSEAAFVPGGTVLLNMNTDFNTEKNLVSGKRFRYHRKGLSIAINGAATPSLTAPNEGVVVRITTSQNSAVDTCDMRIQYI